MDDPNRTNTDAAVIADLATRAIANGVLEEQDVPALVIPNDHSIKDYQDLLPRPQRVVAKVSVRTLQGFQQYVERFMDPNTLVFEMAGGAPGFKAVLDYHEEMEPELVRLDAEHALPRHCSHVCVYDLTFSLPWQTWKRQDGAAMSQVEFAEFLESNAKDVVDPTGAELLEQVQQIKATRKVDFNSEVNHANGDINLGFVRTTTSGGIGALVLPEVMKIGIPVFEGDEPYEIALRLRYRITDDGKLAIWYSAVGLDVVMEDATEIVRMAICGFMGFERVIT